MNNTIFDMLEIILKDLNRALKQTDHVYRRVRPPNWDEFNNLRGTIVAVKDALKVILKVKP